MLLKGGHETRDPRLGRVVQHDPKSRNYPARGVLYGENAPLTTRTWACDLVLDQGQTPHCVGDAFTHELAAKPAPVLGLDQRFADALYNRAQQLDEWPGEAYEGSSGLGGAKACCERGYYREYRHAFGIDDCLQAISHHGPVCLGIPWKDSMFEPRPSGLLEVHGADAGGHEILARGHAMKMRLKGESGTFHVVRLHNSWGTSWGVAGHAFIKVEDLDQLLRADGDVIVPVRRRSRPRA